MSADTSHVCKVCGAYDCREEGTMTDIEKENAKLRAAVNNVKAAVKKNRTSQTPNRAAILLQVERAVARV